MTHYPRRPPQGPPARLLTQSREALTGRGPPGVRQLRPGLSCWADTDAPARAGASSCCQHRTHAPRHMEHSPQIPVLPRTGWPECESGLRLLLESRLLRQSDVATTSIRRLSRAAGAATRQSMEISHLLRLPSAARVAAWHHSENVHQLRDRSNGPACQVPSGRPDKIIQSTLCPTYLRTIFLGASGATA